MKKRLLNLLLVLILAATTVMFVGCSASGEVDSSLTPGVVAGEDTVVTDLKYKPEVYEANIAVYGAIGKLSEYQTYRLEGNGKSVANKGFIVYEQVTGGVGIKHGDEFYTSSTSDSTFVHVMHEAFTKGDNVVYRKDGGAMKNTEKSVYKSVYGVTPDKLLSGQIFNDDTIKYAELVSSADGVYTYKVVLDGNAANAILSYQMREFGGLNGLPTFTGDTIFNLDIAEDFTPIRYSYTSKYKVSTSFLGEIDCEENYSVEFSGYNEENAIPDTDKFNAAMNSEPSTVTPSEPVKGDENKQKIVDALLNSDIENGVTLRGEIIYDGMKLPVKLDLKANINDILAGKIDLRTAVDARLSISSLGDDLSVIYHNGKVYMSALGLKVAFDLPASGLENLGDMISSVDLSSMVNVTADGDYYTVTLNEAIETIIKRVLVENGLAGDGVDEAFNLGLTLYIPNDRVGVIEGNFATDTINAGLKFNLSDEEFILPDLTEYVTELKTGFDLSVKVASVTINGSLYATYDTTETDPLKALKAEAVITLDDTLKMLLGITDGMEGLPGWLSKIGTADTINVIYENRKMALMTVENGEPTFVMEIPLGVSTTETYSEVGDTVSSIFAILSQLFTVNADANGVVVSLNPELTTFVQEFLWAPLTEKFIDLAGEIGIIIPAILETYNPLADLGISVTTNDSGIPTLALYLDVYVLNGNGLYESLMDAINDAFAGGADNMGLVYVDWKDYKIGRLIEIAIPLCVSESVGEYEYEWSIDSILEVNAEATTVINAISELAELEISDEYVAKLEAAKAAYDVLSENAVKLVYNAKNGEVFTEYKNNYDRYKKSVDDFAVECVKENGKITAYNNFNAAQIEYFKTAYANAYATFIEKRTASEATAAETLKTAVAALETVDLAAMTDEQLYEYFCKIETLNNNAARLIAESVSDETREKLATFTTSAVKAYVTRFATLAENAVNELKDPKDKTVDGMNALYAKYESFYETYGSDFSESVLKAEMDAVDDKFQAKCTFVSLYLGNGYGFRKNAVTTVENAIDDLVNSTSYSDEEKQAIIEGIDSLLDLTDETAIRNLEAYNAFKEAFGA